MLGRLIPVARGPRDPHRPETEAGDRQGVLPEEMTAFPPMEPLAPPPAQNDDPLAALCDTVESALREAGFLR
ncbi:hypothetical protein [Methylobacterium oryzihabitans]|uniref:Uncharacterized protein n=1 Tax=Methylobacterium oryzihabitans TaxID=2499852 RepID=A0A3S2VD86_9HYPH|nr:hypothetical protein [Methylobacterium oryzihabitans]RVU21774.1 hypothetical protein EOE48_01630 [Methylobacterium oryzihabitans]